MRCGVMLSLAMLTVQALSQKRDVAGWGCPKLVRILRSTAPSRPAMQSKYSTVTYQRTVYIQ